MNSADDSLRKNPGLGKRELPQTGPLDLVSIQSLYEEGTAEVYRLILEDAGIPCHIENSHQGGLTGVLPVKLLVKQADAERAKRVLQSVKDANGFPDGDEQEEP